MWRRCWASGMEMAERKCGKLEKPENGNWENGQVDVSLTLINCLQRKSVCKSLIHLRDLSFGRIEIEVYTEPIWEAPPPTPFVPSLHPNIMYRFPFSNTFPTFVRFFRVIFLNFFKLRDFAGKVSSVNFPSIFPKFSAIFHQFLGGFAVFTDNSIGDWWSDFHSSFVNKIMKIHEFYWN